MDLTGILDEDKPPKNKSLLNDGEQIIFQIKEGPCAAACPYCYEMPKAREFVKKAQVDGRIPNDIDVDDLNSRGLAKFLTKFRNELGLEMGLEEITDYFDILNDADVTRAGLIGSEPTQHPHFREILDAAEQRGIDILVYTAGMNLKVLEHPAIKHIVLHLDYKRSTDEEGAKRRVIEGLFPVDSYMQLINDLIRLEGKKIDLRVNFEASDMFERYLIYNFFDKLAPENRQKVMLKYSFTCRVADQPDTDYFTPDILRSNANRLMDFVDEFKRRYPDSPMHSERLLFRCAFSKEDWDIYAEKGGFTSTCLMEFTFYPNEGLRLCPPGRNLIQGKQIKDAKELRGAITDFRILMDYLRKVPSFYNCEKFGLCKHLSDGTCYGGCLGYKVGLAGARLINL